VTLNFFFVTFHQEFPERLPKSCQKGMESERIVKSWMYIFQFEEEEDAMQKAIALSLAVDKTKVDSVPAVEAPAYNLTPSFRLNDDERFEALLDAFVSLNLVLPPVYASPKKEPKTAHPSIRNPDRIPFAWRPPKAPNGLWDCSKDFEGVAVARVLLNRQTSQVHATAFRHIF